MKNKRFWIFSAMLLLFITFIAIFQTNGASEQDVPLPSEIEIIAPASDLPVEIAAFSGRWEGTWKGENKHILIVEEITCQKAKIIYAWSESLKSNIRKGCIRYVAKVIPGPPAKIEFGGGKEPKFTFEMKKDLKTIKRTREFKGQYSYNDLERVIN